VTYLTPKRLEDMTPWEQTDYFRAKLRDEYDVGFDGPPPEWYDAPND
jgi:hypothetical protein